MYQQQGCEVMVTGHSLGGYLAEVVATSLGESSGGTWEHPHSGERSTFEDAPPHDKQPGLDHGFRTCSLNEFHVAFLWEGLSCISCNQNIIPSCPVLHP